MPAPTAPSLPPIVDAGWLAARRRGGTAGAAPVVVDARWYLDGGSARGRAAYDAGHIEGALFVDLERCEAGPPSPAAGRHPLPDPARFAECLTALGIRPDSTVVAYDDTGGAAAGRFVWMLRAIGVAAALLDGGLPAWPEPLVERPTSVEAVDRFPVRPWPPELLASPDDVAVAAGSGGRVPVLDARAPERYRGDVEPIDARAGHVPGARNAPYAANVDPATGRFLPGEELRSRYEALGVRAGDDVVVYCGSGVTACHVLLAVEHAGLGRGRLYPGSWSQWSADPSRPVAVGEEP